MAGDPTGIISHADEFHRGHAWKRPCRVATTANITISTALNNGDTIDGVTLATGDRVLVKDQSTGSQNGIYVVGASPARAFDMDQDLTTSVPAEESMGAFVYVIAGTTNGGTLWHTTNTSAPTLGSTSITWEQFSGFDGTALTAAVFGYQAHGNLGSTETFDSTAAGWHSGTLDADCTFTFTAPASGTVGSMVLELTQDGTGGRAITYPGSVVGDFSGYDTTAGTTSLLMFFTRDGGTTWYGFIAGGSGTAVAALNDLTDVDTTGEASGDRLRFDGTTWKPSPMFMHNLTAFDGTNWSVLFDGAGNCLYAEG